MKGASATDWPVETRALLIVLLSFPTCSFEHLYANSPVTSADSTVSAPPTNMSRSRLCDGPLRHRIKGPQPILIVQILIAAVSDGWSHTGSVSRLDFSLAVGPLSPGRTNLALYYHSATTTTLVTTKPRDNKFRRRVGKLRPGRYRTSDALRHGPRISTTNKMESNPGDTDDGASYGATRRDCLWREVKGSRRWRKGNGKPCVDPSSTSLISRMCRISKFIRRPTFQKILGQLDSREERANNTN